jgi:hypothetical protein
MKLSSLVKIPFLVFPGTILALPQGSTSLLPPSKPVQPTTNNAVEPSKPKEMCPLPGSLPGSWGGLNTTALPAATIQANCPTDYRRCSLTQICPSPEICYDQDSGNVFNMESAKKVAATGVCLGHECDAQLKTAYPGNGCRPTQQCVHKKLSMLDSGVMIVRSSASGRCLADTQAKRCSTNSQPGWKCPNGWSCVQDAAEPGELGYCSMDSWEWL